MRGAASDHPGAAAGAAGAALGRTAAPPPYAGAEDLRGGAAWTGPEPGAADKAMQPEPSPTMPAGQCGGPAQRPAASSQLCPGQQQRPAVVSLITRPPAHCADAPIGATSTKKERSMNDADRIRPSSPGAIHIARETCHLLFWHPPRVSKRPSFTVLLTLSLLGCANGPAYESLGEAESYCETPGDCNPGLLCVEAGGERFCTPACAGESECRSGYRCGLGEGVCWPDAAGECRSSDERCGANFPACCSGMCVNFPPFGSYCVQTGCGSDRACASGCCAPTSGGGTVCAPPSFC